MSERSGRPGPQRRQPDPFARQHRSAAPPAPALPRWQRWLVYTSAATVAGSGLVWLWAHYGLTGDGEFGAGEHPAARWALAAHGVTAYALLLAVGTLAPVHVRVAWRLHRNRLSGALVLAMALGLAGSGLWLYYGGTSGRDGLAVAHWAAGIGSIGLVWWHRRRGRASRRTAP